MTGLGRSPTIKKRVCYLWLIPVLAGCTSTSTTPNALNPQGPGASQIAGLWWLMFALGTLVYLLVLALLFYALWRKRKGQDSSEKTKKRSRRFIIGGGVIFPAIILLVVFASTLDVLAGLNELRAGNRVTIEVVGHQWWWEVNYPGRFKTANEIHIPAGEPVQVKLTSADVIHSFWVPELQGKLDLIPGRSNTVWLEADQPGQYWGVCAEFCGIQHAKMRFVVVAQPRDSFEQWLDRQEAPAAVPQNETARDGQSLFMEKECGDCHVVRGTAADGDLGPDLTHFAGRLTLGAGIALNTPDDLARWIVDPHTMKEGNFMPAADLTEEELSALMAYLQSLD